MNDGQLIFLLIIKNVVLKSFSEINTCLLPRLRARGPHRRDIRDLVWAYPLRTNKQTNVYLYPLTLNSATRYGPPALRTLLHARIVTNTNFSWKLRKIRSLILAEKSRFAKCEIVRNLSFGKCKPKTPISEE